MNKLLSLVLVCTLAICTIPLGGCNALSSAQKAQQVIGAVLSVAQAEVNEVPPADQPIYNNFVALGNTLNTQLGTCLSQITSLMGMGTGSKVKACFTTFATGLTTPAELAQLHILSATGQGKVQLIVSGAIAAVNIIVAFATPVVAAPAVKTAEIDELINGVSAMLDTKFTCSLQEDGVTLSCSVND